MGAVDTLIGWAGGILTALVGWWVYRHTVERNKAQDYFSSLKDVIASQEKAVQEAQEGPEREEAKHKLAELREDLRLESKGWRETHRPPGIVPRGAITADEVKPLAEEVEQLRQWLANTSKAPPELLSAEDYFIRGNAYYEAGEYERALEAYSRSLKLLPDHPGTLNNRGLALHQLERYEEALADYEHAVQVAPDLPELLYNRGNTLLEMKCYEDTIKSYTSALDLKPDYVNALINRGIALARMGRYEDALKDFNRALKLRLDYPDTLNNRGLTLAYMGRYEDAFKDINRALELRPDYPDTLYNRACAYSLWGKFEEALQDLEAAIKGDEKLREVARKDEDKDFEKLRNDPEYGPRFRELVGE